MSTTKNTAEDVFHLGDLLQIEKEIIKERRRKRNRSEELEKDSLGLALSGGGIRSATICLGIVEKLNHKEILEKTDYLSTVSGGGYLGAYIHTALNTAPKKRLRYQELFNEKDIKHLRSYREYLYLFPKYPLGRFISKLYMLAVALCSTLLNLLWLILPIAFYCIVQKFIVPQGSQWYFYVFLTLLMMLIIGALVSPNFSSPHRFYKRRLRKAYMSRHPKIKLLELNNPLAPYPLINATLHVDYDKYDQASNISYRGRIRSNYFLFSPAFCGSQVTRFTPTEKFHYKNKTLATAMATSAAAVNTFMGNQDRSSFFRNFMALANWRTGILAPNPQLKKWQIPFWPYYTLYEVLGKPNTTTHRIQVSDGGHIENLGVYELLRRQVKVIIAIDAGEDNGFKFEDLRNLVVRANSELGIDFIFHERAMPEQVIRPSAANGFSNRNFVVAKLIALEGSYAFQNNYEGLFIYLKSSVLVNETYRLRKMKKALVALGESKEESSRIQEMSAQKRELDSWMYKTYNPDFPHEPTADQFFDEAQWDAYHNLGRLIGEKLIDQMGIKKGMDGADLFEIGKAYFDRY